MSANDVDLNLLRVLDALLEEGSVAGAAQQLHLSPPAVSRSLGRLRRALDDPLLVRSGRGLVPTPRALAMRSEVQRALAAATSVLTPAPDEFDPIRLKRRFTISADDGLVASLGLLLVDRIHDQAPSVGLDFLPDTNEVELLRSGRIDLDLGAPDGFGAEIESEELAAITFAAALRHGHPLAEANLTARRYAHAHHVVVSSKGRAWGPVDVALAEQGLRRDRVTVVPSFAAAAHMVAGSDAIGLIPTAIVLGLGRRLGLQATPLPVSTGSVSMCQSWHPRFSRDPGHRWLRSVVRQLGAEISS